jgi:hypothetical protein
MDMARERVLSQALHLRVEEALSNELKRIAAWRNASESKVARMLLGWRVEAHPNVEAKKLLRPYDVPESDWPARMLVEVRWEEFDPETGETIVSRRYG